MAEGNDPIPSSGQAQSTATPVASPYQAADTAMATGTDDEPEMTIGDKHAGDTLPDTDGDGMLSEDEAAALLGAGEEKKKGG